MHAVDMIVTDLDRTLLRSDKTLSERTVDVLRRCRARGIPLAYATARPLATVRHFLPDVPVDAMILHNGAEVRVGGDRLWHRAIPAPTAAALLRALAGDPAVATLSAEIDGTLYANFDASTVWASVVFVRTDFTDLPDAPAEKIIVGVTSMDDVRRYAAYLPADLYIEMCDGKLGLIMHREATKWNALRALAAHMGAAPERIVAFGDDYNDIGMLRGCGTGVAMGNALADVLAVADDVAATNDEDGVALWLAAHVLGDAH